MKKLITAATFLVAMVQGPAPQARADMWTVGVSLCATGALYCTYKSCQFLLSAADSLSFANQFRKRATQLIAIAERDNELASNKPIALVTRVDPSAFARFSILDNVTEQSKIDALLAEDTPQNKAHSKLLKIKQKETPAHLQRELLKSGRLEFSVSPLSWPLVTIPVDDIYGPFDPLLNLGIYGDISNLFLMYSFERAWSVNQDFLPLVNHQSVMANLPQWQEEFTTRYNLPESLQVEVREGLDRAPLHGLQARHSAGYFETRHAVIVIKNLVPSSDQYVRAHQFLLRKIAELVKSEYLSRKNKLALGFDPTK